MPAPGWLAGLHHHVSSGGSILCYHSLTSAELPSAGIVNVPVDEYHSVMQVVRRSGEIVSLREVVRRHQAGLSTAGLIAVTFDDAYAAVLATVEDRPGEVRVPITLFVVTDAARAGTSYWWDRVEDVFARVSPERWRAFEDTIGLPAAYRIGQPADLGPLRPLRQWILAAHGGRWPAALEQPLAALEAGAGWTTRHRSMTFDELDRLGSLPEVEIGVHTQTHAVLPLLPDGEVRQEILGSYHTLRERYAGKAVPLLAFPFGLFDGRTARLASDVGMQAAFGLGNRTLRDVPRSGVLPRFIMAVGETRWRLALKLLGVRERLRRGQRGALACPVLPSATS